MQAEILNLTIEIRGLEKGLIQSWFIEKINKNQWNSGYTSKRRWKEKTPCWSKNQRKPALSFPMGKDHKEKYEHSHTIKPDVTDVRTNCLAELTWRKILN